MMTSSKRSRYTIDPMQGYVYLRCEGRPDVDSMLADLRAISADPRCAAGCDELLDLRGSRFEASERQLRGLALNLAAMRPLLGNRRTAWIVDDDLSFGMIRVLMSLSESEHRAMNVFRDLDRACRWLGLDEAAKRPLGLDDASIKIDPVTMHKRLPTG